MRPALVNYEYPGITDNCGGGGRVTQLLNQRLTDRGYAPQLVTDYADKHYVTSPLRLFRTLQQTTEIGLVHAHFSVPSGLAGAYYVRETADPFVVSVMGADIYDPTRYRYLAHARDWANRYVLSTADRVVAPSTDMADRVERRFGVDCTVIHYGIDPDAYRWRERALADSPTILTVCRHVERKNLDNAIEAVATLRHGGYDVTYRIVGTGPERRRLRRKYGHYDWLGLPGYAENLQAVYDDADLFFLPSHHEAFGIVFLEALAAGLPVVASDCGGQTDIVRDGVGELAPPESIQEQYQCLKQVLDEYERYQAATKAYVADNFSAAQMADDYVALYRDVTDSRPESKRAIV